MKIKDILGGNHRRRSKRGPRIKRIRQEELISESGSAPGVGPIHRDEIEATLAPISKFVGIDLSKQVLGSVGKKQFSGDIDVAINIPPEEWNAFQEKLENNPLFSYVEKTSVYITKIKIQNYDPDRTFVDPRTGEDKGVPQGRTGYVQLDFMPGNPGWLKTYYHSPSETESKYKGVFRNLMIASIAGQLDKQESSERIDDGRPVEMERWMWSPSDGLVRVKRTPVPKSNGQGYTKKNNNEIIDGPYKDANTIAKVLGLGSAADLNSYETVKAAIEKNYPADLVQRILADFVRNPTVQDVGIPEDLI